jgi:hypothetical protein
VPTHEAREVGGFALGCGGFECISVSGSRFLEFCNLGVCRAVGASCWDVVAYANGRVEKTRTEAIFNSEIRVFPGNAQGFAPERTFLVSEANIGRDNRIGWTDGMDGGSVFGCFRGSVQYSKLSPRILNSWSLRMVRRMVRTAHNSPP